MSRNCGVHSGNKIRNKTELNTYSNSFMLSLKCFAIRLVMQVMLQGVFIFFYTLHFHFIKTNELLVPVNLRHRPEL